MHNLKHKVEKILLNFVHITESKAKVESNVKDKCNKNNEDDGNILEEISSSRSEFSVIPNRRSVGSFVGDTIRSNGNNPIFDIDTNLYLKMFIHELRAPISTISMGIDILENTEQSKVCKETLKDMKKDVLFLNDIFSKFALIQNGNITLNTFSTFSLRTFFKGLETSLQYLFTNAKSHYECKIHDDVYDWNYGDKYNLLHCFFHLLKNAIKYRSNERSSVVRVSVTVHTDPLSVTLTTNADNLENEIKLKKKYRLTSITQNEIHPTAPTEPAPSTGRRSSIFSRTIRESTNNLNETTVQVIQFSVFDNNDPILPDIKEHLFEPFNTTGGSGMGLYICKNIIELHGGSITYHFSQPHSNEFKIILPLKKCAMNELYANDEINKSSENIRHYNLQDTRITEECNLEYNVLFVDDSILNRKIAFKLLRTCGCFNTVRTAENGSHAIESVLQKLDNYDLILLDKNIPKIDGIATAKILRGLKYKNLIIGLTGEDNINVDRLFLESGADYVFLKPLDNNKITLMVDFMRKYSSKHIIDKNVELMDGKLEWV